MSGIHMGLLASRPPGPAFVASDVNTTVATTTVSVNKPAGVVAGHLLIAVMATPASAGPRTWTGDAGWNERVDQGVVPNLRIATLVAGASEPASYTFTVSGTGLNLGAFILAFERASFDVIGAIGTSTAPTNCIAPSINSSLPGLMLGIFMGSTAPWTTPAGMTLLVAPAGIYVFSQFTNIGASGTRTSTPSGANDTAGVLLGMF